MSAVAVLTAEKATDAAPVGDEHAPLGFLDDLEFTVIRRRFGLDGDNAATLEQVGRELGCSGERVRKIEAKALRRLNARQGLGEDGAACR